MSIQRTELLQAGCSYDERMMDVKWIKKWSYLVLLTAVGLVYLSLIDGWQVYAEPLSRVQGWIQGTKEGSQGSDDDILNSSGQDILEAWAELPETEGESETELNNQDGTGAVPDPGEPGGQQDGTDENDADNNGGFGDGSEPVYMTVEDDYFSDAVFIGDSRTVGMYEYGGLEEITTFYASTGLTIYKIFDSAIVEVPGQRQKITIEEALGQNQFKKIYLMIGINEMGTGTVETFVAKYQEVVEHLLELQPEAIIYIQGILKVTTERSNQGDYITNEGIVDRNEALSQLADNVRIFYLDANPMICDSTGGLEPSYTFDGVHLKAKYVEIWKDYLKNHAVNL